jgi:RNA polymerase sigma factor (sigma-70 family)
MLQAIEGSTFPDELLIDRSIQGDRAALEALLRRHQTRIFNLALYMLQTRADAEDATQEILLKAVTGLSTFQGKSTFPTWLHRIAVNHLLDRRRSRPEESVRSFECYAGALDAAKDEANPSSDPHTALLIEEARHACVLGMLLCLDRNQRMAFVLGELLELPDRVGAELLELTRDGFRQRLARARAQLSSFMQGRCGLVEPANPCRCARKTAAFIASGIVDPHRLQFTTRALASARASVAEERAAIDALQRRAPSPLYPLFDAPDFAEEFGRLVTRPPANQEPHR